MRDASEWAEWQFGHSELGDIRRVRRLVAVAKEVARCPAGTVMKACETSASREGAFRLLENKAVGVEPIRAAICERTGLQSRNERQVIVAIDATSLTLADAARARALGAVGPWKKGSRGIHVMTALVLRMDGSTLGIGAQSMWTRDSKTPSQAGPASSENRYWLKTLNDVDDSLADHAPECRPWYQLDRGADWWAIYALAQERGLLMTVRATHDRRMEGAGHLWPSLQQAPVSATRKIEVCARPAVWRKKRHAKKRSMIRIKPRKPRVATVKIRAAKVTLECSTPNGRRLLHLNAVYVLEKGRTKADRLEWMLLTTHSILTARDVLEVVRAYALRWRIEEFHRMWKRGYCRVEDTQLHSRGAIFKWATILAAVATRAMRLTHMARRTPDAPALAEFSAAELKALIALRRPKDVADDFLPTLGLAVRWLADIGGYSGPWNGPPGHIVIGRGLYQVAIAARVIEFQEKKQPRKR